MKKIASSIPTGGAPISDDILETVFNAEIWTALESILQGASDPAATGNNGIIISGCKVTGAGPYNCSSGIVYIAGQFMAFPGFTAQTLPQYILPATLINTAKVFADGASKNLITQQDATFQSGVPGVQYIALTTTGNLGSPGGFNLEVNGGVRTAGPGVYLKSKVYQIGAWNMDTTANSPSITSGIITKNIRSASVIIRNDADTSYFDQSATVAFTETELSVSWDVTVNTISVSRRTGGLFDGVNFSTTAGPYNRGWVTIWYEA